MIRAQNRHPISGFLRMRIGINDLETICGDSVLLQERMFAALAGARIPPDEIISVTLAGVNGMCSAAIRPSDGCLAATSHVPTGCTAKLLTAAAAVQELGGNPAALGMRLVDALQASMPAWCSDITVQHLLDHTHGIDAPFSAMAPVRTDGYLDVQRLCAEIGPAPIAAPGEHYSYSHTGHWLLAALLEVRTGKRYRDLVRAILDADVSDDSPCSTYCPSTGRGYAVPQESFLAFLRRSSSRENHSRPLFRLDPGSVVRFPGWNPLEYGVCQSWKVYDNGWYGHQSTIPGALLAIRVQVTTGLAFLVTTRSILPPWVVNRIFDRSITGLSQPPSRLPAPAYTGERISDNDAVGSYARCNSRVVIRTAEGAGLALHSTQSKHTSASRTHVAELVPIAPSVYQVRPNDGHHFFHLGFVRTPEGKVSHLWNGSALWRKVE